MRLLSASVYGLWVKYTLAVVTGILVCIRSINAAILHQTPSHFMVRHQFNKMTHLSMGKVDSTDMDVKLGRYVTKAALDLQALILASKETKDKRKESKGDDKMSMSITNGSRTSGHHYVLENAYIVELNADAGTQAAVREQEAFKNTLDKLGIVWKPRYTFNTIMNGMSITIPNAYVDTILAMSMVKQAWPIVATNRPRHFTETVMGKKSSLQDAHDFTGVNLLHEEGYSGRGVRVAIIDSGIDYRHPALGNCYGRNDPTAKCLIAFGYDFVGDEYDGVTYLAKEDDDPMDTCNGHGTHVAGIIGADSKVLRGVAPNVTFGIYRVFGCTGYGEDDVILAAMERAVQDGMEVINMSMGSGSAWAASPLSLAAARLVERGIVVVAASGNDGDKGLWQISAPGIGKNVISVASMDSFEYYTYGIRTDTGEDIDYWRGHLERINLGKTKLVLARNLSLNHLSRKDSDINSNPNMTDNTGCSALGSHVKNNVVLVDRGGCSFTEKVKNADKAGARAILIYNNELGLVDPTSDDNSIPYASLSQTNGHKLVRLIESRLGNAARSGWNKRNKKKDDEKTDRGRDAYPYVGVSITERSTTVSQSYWWCSFDIFIMGTWTKS
jgi:minor extracellular serine protease Vpr